jgi:hypothetical protein
MNAFMKEFCAGNDTEKVRELLLSAKKPKDMTIRDFIARIKQLNRYIEYLPPPLNRQLGDDEILAVIRRSVPSWSESLTRSAQTPATLQALTTYYQDLEELEITQRNRNTRRRENQQRNRNQDRGRNERRGNQYRRENNYAEQRNNVENNVNRNENNNNNENNHQNTYRPNFNNNNQRNNSHQNRNDQRNNNNNRNYNNNRQHGYNLRPRCGENHRFESDDESRSSSGSVSSNRSSRSTD